MNLKNSLIGRIAMGKLMGLVIGGIAFFTIPSLFPAADLWLRYGVWVWYITLGALIGLFGVMDYHPMLKFRMPFWFRGIMLGGWMNFVLVLFLYPTLLEFLNGFTLGGIAFENPFWLVLDGAIIGLIIDFFATKYGGEGSGIV